MVRVQRAESSGGISGERVEILDECGEPVLTLTFAQVYQVAAQLVQVGVEITCSYPDVSAAVISEPAVTPADLASAFEMGRRAGLRGRR